MREPCPYSNLLGAVRPVDGILLTSTLSCLSKFELSFFHCTKDTAAFTPIILSCPCFCLHLWLHSCHALLWGEKWYIQKLKDWVRIENMGTCKGKARRLFLNDLQRLRCERTKLILTFKKVYKQIILFCQKEPRANIRTAIQFPIVLVALSWHPC